jgi:hypothetical protein
MVLRLVPSSFGEISTGLFSGLLPKTARNDIHGGQARAFASVAPPTFFLYTLHKFNFIVIPRVLEHQLSHYHNIVYHLSPWQK